VGEKKPSNYSEKLPRVSSIVEFFYPFTNESRSRFYDWLSLYKVMPSDYMHEASTWGTYVHSMLEKYMKWSKITLTKYKGFIEWWIQFIKDFNINPLWMEVYIRTKKYQWTIDLIAEIDWEKWVLDWKTWGLSKHKFNIPISAYKKPSDKLKKARLQLSLYALAKRIKNIWVIELTATGYHFHKLEIMPSKEINEMLKEYLFHYVDEL
jgi:hypothetical protein